MALAERFVWRALAQVTRYLTDEAVRAAAQRIVLDLIGAETSVVLAHSLGSVVAYEALHQILGPLPLFVTIGSPLGIETVIYPRLRPQPPTYPASVRRWINVADKDDLIAAEPELSSMFSAGIPDGAVLEGLYTVDNGARPHRAEFYLTKEQVGRPIVEAFGLSAVGPTF